MPSRHPAFIVRGQNFAVRFVAHFMALTPDHRVRLVDVVAGAGDASRTAAQQLRDAASAVVAPAPAGPGADLGPFFAALDALVAAVVADPAHRDAFATFYAPIAAVIPFDTLLLE